MVRAADHTLASCISNHVLGRVVLVSVHALQALDGLGNDVDHEDHDQSTPLILACAGGHTKTAMMLLDKGANIHHEAKYGRSPITYACNWGRTATALMLLTRGSRVNHETKDGAIPLTRACANGHIETAIILIEMGANMEHRDKTSRTPLDYIVDQSIRDGMQKAIEAYKATKSAIHQEFSGAMESKAKDLERERIKDRFRYMLSGILAGGRCANLQMSLLQETAKSLQEEELDDIFTSQSCSWDRLAWMNRKTNMEGEELENLRRYMSCRQF